MDEIRLYGREFDFKVPRDVTIGGNGIDITPDELKSQLKPDLGKLKVGDRVWVEVKFDRRNQGQFFITPNKYCYSEEDIVAIFPSKPEPEKKVELPERLYFPVQCEGEGYSEILGKLINAVNSIRDYLKQMKEKP